MGTFNGAVNSCVPKNYLVVMANIRQNRTQCCTMSNANVLDTLAQLDKNGQTDAYRTLKKRALAKYFTNEILYPLIDLKNEREQSYWNTYHCVRTMLQDTQGKVTTSYCKNRWCMVCNRIRTGIYINTYSKRVQALDTRFLTLTSEMTKKCVTMAELEHTIKFYKTIFLKIQRKMKRNFGNLGAIRKLEVTWNTKNKWFHPHFHVILENKNDSVKWFYNQWINTMAKHNVKVIEHKNAISVTDKNTLNELFKYFTKLVKVEKSQDKLAEKRVLPYPPQIMDNIFQVMHGQRVVQSYGTLFGSDCEDFENEVATVFTNEQRTQPIIWNWEQELRTWIDYDTGELRTYD